MATKVSWIRRGIPRGYPQLHLYPSKHPCFTIDAFYDARSELDRTAGIVHTTQMALLGSDAVRHYHIYIHEDGHTVRLINNGHGWDCDDIDKDLRYEHNLLRIWMTGGFNC